MFDALNVDLSSDVVLTDAELSVRCQSITDCQYPQIVRERILRTGEGKDALDQFFVDLSAAKAVANARYNAITLRLAQRAVANCIATGVDSEDETLIALEESVTLAHANYDAAAAKIDQLETDKIRVELDYLAEIRSADAKVAKQQADKAAADALEAASLVSDVVTEPVAEPVVDPVPEAPVVA